jgi:hypothetical protein
MKRDEILEALNEVGIELERRAISARVLLVVGAVMVLAHGTRDATDDIDGDFCPRGEVRAVAQEVAVRRGLSSDWLNSAALGFIPVFKEPDWQPVVKLGSLEVAVADDRTMLAMKIRASRGRRDEPDLAVLLKKCAVTSVDQAFELYDEYFPEDPAPKRSRLMLEHLLDAGRES